MIKNFTWTIPNVLSLYRLIMFPIIFYALWVDLEEVFAMLICINLITDILDGWIARRFNQATEVGARLDSMADMGTYLLSFAGVFYFKADLLQDHLLALYPFFLLFALCHILPLIRFKRLPSFHLYSWKIGGYIQGIWFASLFFIEFWPSYYYFMVIWGILAFSEHLIIQFLISRPASNLKGLYWVLQTREAKKVEAN
tara:strand:- start:380 stop:973 length:594 start_codon:yes stop_codon:yes gene_type:complete